ncbi:MAG: transcription elongation factor GreA [Bradymonadales bacterium]|nr:transcription elongation factor GreA [Bradymonadales bacterium]
MTELPITPQGLVALKEELERMQRVDMPQIVKEIEVAREKGDLSENAEYHAAKDRQGQIQGKIKFLRERIGRSRVIDPRTLSGSRVVFGAIVTVVDLDTEVEQTYQIVGEDEADFKAGKISVTSPLARGLLGAEEGDEVKIKTPKGLRTLEIGSVEFPRE